jgi:hypothetical protein
MGGRYVLLGSMTSSRKSTADSWLACAEDAESDYDAAAPRRRTSASGCAGRSSGTRRSTQRN